MAIGKILNENGLERAPPAEFSETRFWQKLGRSARSAGKSVLEVALKLYFASRDPDTPLWAKAVIVSALGYFVAPIDAIPDVIPGAGFADDWGVLAAAIATVAAHIKKEHSERARQVLSHWFS